jgi:hypothetical protein
MNKSLITGLVVGGVTVTAARAFATSRVNRQ